MQILIDDKKNIDSGIICRDIASAKLLFQNMAEQLQDHELLLDHDFGDSRLLDQEENGCTFLEWARDNQIELPRKIILVSYNPAGVKNMEAILQNDLGYINTHDKFVYETA